MGVLSIENGFVFVHVPRTGGQSLARALRTRGAALKTLPGLAETACGTATGIERVEHARARDLAAFLGPDRWNALYAFGVVRNPWDRLVSLFHYIRQTPLHRRHSEVTGMSFARFVRDGAAQKPMTEWLEAADGARLVTEILRFEEMRHWQRRVFERCGIRGDAPLLRVNASNHGDFRGYYTDALAAEVAVLCAADIARFGYSFDGDCHPA